MDSSSDRSAQKSRSSYSHMQEVSSRQYRAGLYGGQTGQKMVVGLLNTPFSTTTTPSSSSSCLSLPFIGAET